MSWKHATLLRTWLTLLLLLYKTPVNSALGVSTSSEGLSVFHEAFPVCCLVLLVAFHMSYFYNFLISSIEWVFPVCTLTCIVQNKDKLSHFLSSHFLRVGVGVGNRILPRQRAVVRGALGHPLATALAPSIQALCLSTEWPFGGCLGWGVLPSQGQALFQAVSPHPLPCWCEGQKNRGLSLFPLHRREHDGPARGHTACR